VKTIPSPDLPRAHIRKRSRFSPIWIVPLLAAVVAGWLIYKNLQQNGPLITIFFNNGNGLQVNQTILKYHGVRVGEVHSLQLSKDLNKVVVQVRLLRSAEGLARQGSQFWIVRPEVNSAGLHGLETIVSGPYIQAKPGTGSGKLQKLFVGTDESPVDDNSNNKYEIVVTTPQITTMSIGAPVYYRGVEVGQVSYFGLSDTAQQINVHLLIETNYANLVRVDSKFWNAGGLSVRLKLLGINVTAENFKSLVIGGIAFATPTNPGVVAPAGTIFTLFPRSEDDWMKWSPSIPITSLIKGNSTSATPAMLLNDVAPADK
jgi:paraquat-inducible protein B